MRYALRRHIPDSVAIPLEEVEVDGIYLGQGRNIHMVIDTNTYEIIWFSDGTLAGRVKVPVPVSDFCDLWVKTRDGVDAIDRAIEEAA